MLNEDDYVIHNQFPEDSFEGSISIDKRAFEETSQNMQREEDIRIARLDFRWALETLTPVLNQGPPGEWETEWYSFEFRRIDGLPTADDWIEEIKGKIMTRMGGLKKRSQEMGPCTFNESETISY